MKKLFTLVALLAVFMGAKAEWVEDYSIDYSTKDNFPFFVMGYVPEWVGGVMTDYGADYRYATQADLDGDGDAKWKDGEESVGTAMAGSNEYQKVTGAGPYWHQYIIAADVPMELDGTYTIKAMVKSSAAVNANLQFGNWGKLKETQVTIPQSNDFQEVEWEVTGCLNAGNGFICIQPGTSTATIEWKSLKVSHNAKQSKPTVWQQWLTNDGNSIIPEVAHTNKYVGDAETAWPAWALETTDGINANWRGDRTGEICAWALTMGKNYDDQNTVISEDSPRARPYPADIEPEPGNTSNHVFAVHVKNIEPIDDNNPETDDAASIAWSNQFWIQSPKGWPAGTKVKIKFRYKASTACKVGTQIHKQHPSDYLFWNAVGDVNFTTEWQEFEKDLDFSSDTNNNTAGGWSLAFNLNADETNGRTAPIDFYFDDLSWETMKLDEGFFVAGANTEGGLQYDFDNAIEFTWDEDDEAYAATIGDKDDESTWVNEVMISTVRGNDAAFKSKTLKPSYIKNDPDEWPTYTESSLAKLTLPGTGAWRILIDTEELQMNFVMIAGKAKEAVDIIKNEEEVVISAVEREPTSQEQPADEEAGTPAGTGATWDNQFFIFANRKLNPGEVTVLEFDYSATKEARSTSAWQNENGYVTGAFNLEGDNIFNTEVKHFKQTLTVPAKTWQGNEIDGITFISFDLACIKDANDYTFTNIKWYLADEELNANNQTMENLISATGTSNFKKKIGAGTDIIPLGIINVINNATIGSDVIYNLSGQRVSKDYKGIVIMNGRKVVNK